MTELVLSADIECLYNAQSGQHCVQRRQTANIIVVVQNIYKLKVHQWDA